MIETLSMAGVVTGERSAAIASLCLWWVGVFAQQKGWYRHFQANTVVKRRVLSIPFLALQVIQREDYFIRVSDLDTSLSLLTNLIYKANEG